MSRMTEDVITLFLPLASPVQMLVKQLLIQINASEDPHAAAERALAAVASDTGKKR